eukprot:m.472875 g.472875  ORF g.472875 m.472875 type:complete len:400 (+) comp33423_c0_seq1:125-1324(+)
MAGTTVKTERPSSTTNSAPDHPDVLLSYTTRATTEKDDNAGEAAMLQVAACLDAAQISHCNYNKTSVGSGCEPEWVGRVPNCRAAIVMLSPGYFKSEQCLRELITVLQSTLKDRIVSVVVTDPIAVREAVGRDRLEEGFANLNMFPGDDGQRRHCANLITDGLTGNWLPASRHDQLLGAHFDRHCGTLVQVLRDWLAHQLGGPSAAVAPSYTITAEPAISLVEYSTIPISFEVKRVMDIGVDPAGCLTLAEHPVDSPYTKDYDSPGNTPLDWPTQFDVSHWGFLAARDPDGQLIGGAALAYQTPKCNMLEGRDDLAVLWDLRVAPTHRRAGVGRALFRAAVEWARCHGATELVVETQQINAAACRFYRAQGCVLTTATPGAYDDLPDEVKLIWRLSIPP